MDIKYTILIIALLNFIIGFSVLSRNRKSGTNISFALVSFDLGLWAVSMFFYVKPFVFDSEAWIKIVYLFVIGLAVTWTYFFRNFLEVKDKIAPILISLAALIFVFILIGTDFWVKGVVVKSWGPETILGPAYALFGIYILFAMGWVTYIFIKRLSQSRGIQRMQFIYIFVGTILYSILATIFDVVIPLSTGDSRFFWVSTYFSLFFVVATAYAIIRYRLMDIRFVAGRTFVYLFSIISILGLMFFLMFLNNKLSSPISINIFVPIATAIGILLFQPIFQFFEQVASKYFYYTFYSYQTVLTDLGRRLTQFLDLDRLSSLIVNTLTSTMKLDRTVILLREAGNGDYRIQKNVGFREENGISLVKDSFLTAWLEKSQTPLVYEELSLIIRDTFKKEEKESLEKIRENMKKIEAALCLPLFIENRISGMIVLGSKISGEPYSQQDIALLNTLANQSSVALQNARLYDQVHDLSENLQEKVDTQTKELKQAYEELKVLDRAKSEFISLASHQLRTPLTAIRGYVSMILEGSYGKLSKSASKPLNNVLGSAERLIRIVNDLLNISKIELGKMELNKALARVDELITTCYEEMKPTAEKKGLEIIWQKPKSRLPEIEIDKLKIGQVISNLIDNAIKYTQKGKIEIKAEKADSVILVSIKDTGEGLTKDEIRMVFEGFTRGAAGIAYWIEGAGLGLYIAKKYIDLHNGKIWVESEGKGKGSAFYVELAIK
ncbi:MAG: ATP-binding protein [Candidatus Paceibacterota bacterium]